MARAVWAAFDAWGEGAGRNSGMELNIRDRERRSHAVTTVRFEAPHATRLREWVNAHAGVTLGIGLGMVPPGDPGADGFLRIAHMGHVNPHMTLGVLTSIEAELKALGGAHGEGALGAASQVVADAAPELAPLSCIMSRHDPTSWLS